MNNDQAQLCIKELRELAEELTTCTHQLCSMAEGVHEEIYGKLILNILEKYDETGEQNE